MRDLKDGLFNDMNSIEKPSDSIVYKVAEVMMYSTCNYNCGYCSFVTSGSALNFNDMEPFKDISYIDSIVAFFNQNSTHDQKWILQLSGGEPLIAPNLNYFAERIISSGHKIRYNTNLAVPVDKDQKWLDANPPAAIDVMMVSLHPESLGRYEIIFNRMKKLKNMGYRLIARLVAHPRLMDWMDRLEDDFKSAGITFSPIPMYSVNYPMSYTDDERAELGKHIKCYSALIQLKGGLEMRDRLCCAGSRLIAVGLGKSGGGNVYRCVSCSPSGYLGNIFKGDVKLMDKPAPCCQKDQHCTCSMHFEADIIPGAEDGENYEKMKNGSPVLAQPTFEAWALERNLEFKRHKVKPMGTAYGERHLIFDRSGLLADSLGNSPSLLFSWSGSVDSGFSLYKEGVKTKRINSTMQIDAPGVHGGGVRFMATVNKGVKCAATIELENQTSPVTLAVYSNNEPHFWFSVNENMRGECITEVFEPRSNKLELYVYCDQPIKFTLKSIKVYQGT